MNKPILFGTTLLALFVTASLLPLAAAQYVGEEGAQGNLEEQLKLAAAKVKAAQDNPATGSGTPYLDANGVVGGSVIVGAVFGGIAIAFIIRGRSGKFQKAN